jgi:hypothetical protein
VTDEQELLDQVDVEHSAYTTVTIVSWHSGFIALDAESNAP